jgi:DNA-binding CsgD family transcriptional regulator
MTVDIAGALAVVEESAGDLAAAEAHSRFLLERWGETEDRHYAVSGLRRGASVFAALGDGGSTRSCADALATIAADSGHLDARAALTFALGEAALVDGDADGAAEQLTLALGLHQELDIPFERAHVALRAGVAFAAAGDRDPALDRLALAYRLARKLGARPLENAAAAEVSALGESIEERLGTRAATEHDRAGLSRRELEVMRLVAVGKTNREIAAELVVSTRTVDMHVRNILAKLDCRSRVEAASRAGELGILVSVEA